MIIDACTCPLSSTGSEAYLFTERFFSECQYNPRMLASYIIGLLSLVCWMCVATPQIILQMFKQKADGISLLFLLLWFSGDITYIISTSLTDALPTTQFLAVWYVISDLLIDLQTVWYVFVREKAIAWREAERRRRAEKITREPVEGESVDTATRRTEISEQAAAYAADIIAAGPNKTYERGTFLTAVWSIVSAAVAMALMYLITQGVNRLHMEEIWITRSCSSTGSSEKTGAYIFGQIMGYVNIPLFVGSRPAQIYKNWKRKSTEGVAPAFFVLTLLGNVTQGLSILIQDPTPNGDTYKSYIIGQIPYLCSSIGIAVFDAWVLTQCFIYRGRAPEEEPKGGSSIELMTDADVIDAAMKEEGQATTSSSAEMI